LQSFNQQRKSIKTCRKLVISVSDTIALTYMTHNIATLYAHSHIRRLC